MAITRIFYTTDLHGSERVFIKFLNAAKMYNAHVVIMGGDMTGKMIVPIVKIDENTVRSKLLGTEVIARDKAEVQKLEDNIRFNGFYPYYTDSAEMEQLNKDQSKVDALFNQLMAATLKRWIGLAEQRLKDLKAKIYMTPGNDDSFAIDDVLNSSNAIVNPEGKVVMIDDYHEMISSGYSNPTPWNSPRESSEQELESKIETMASQVKDMKRCIFNFHCPPYNSGIDVAPRIGKDLKPVVSPGTGVEMIAVGSTAVRNAIEKHQPMMGLHGHIHEARGEAKIGRTVCYNPGSEYGEGILRGIIVNIDEKGIKSRLFVSG
jgi:Icc-related predicted phosphoesterase